MPQALNSGKGCAHHGLLQASGAKSSRNSIPELQFRLVTANVAGTPCQCRNRHGKIQCHVTIILEKNPVTCMFVHVCPIHTLKVLTVCAWHSTHG